MLELLYLFKRPCCLILTFGFKDKWKRQNENRSDHTHFSIGRRWKYWGIQRENGKSYQQSIVKSDSTVRREICY